MQQGRLALQTRCGLKSSLPGKLDDMALLKKKFYFVRHGETDWNKMSLCQGHTDIALNDTGKKQAEALGEKIGTFPFCSIWASPLKRAHETALILNKSLPHLSMTLVDELKERYYGQFEGGSSKGMREIDDHEEKNPHFYSEKGVEPKEKLKERLIQGINQALQASVCPLIVSHGRVFMELCQILNVPIVRQVPNTALILCQPTASGWGSEIIRF